MSNGSVRGRFVWHDLMTSDPQAAVAFYCGVVGWKSQVWGQGVDYTMFVAPSGPVGGVMTLPEEARTMGATPHWLTYIGTPDCDATCARAAELGGRVLKAPGDIPTVGRFAILLDPFGAAFAVFTPLAGAPAGAGEPGLGEFSWHELATRELGRGFGFYAELFGWEVTSSMDMGPDGVYQMFGIGGVPLGGVYEIPASRPMPPHWLPYAMVHDAHRATKALVAAGGSVIHGPMEVPGGDWITMAMDPQGAGFAVHARKPANVAPAKEAAKPATRPAARPAKRPAKKKPAKAKAAPKKAAKKRAAKPARKQAPKRAARKAAKAPARRPVRSAAKKKAAKKKAARRPARKK